MHLAQNKRPVYYEDGGVMKSGAGSNLPRFMA